MTAKTRPAAWVGRLLTLIGVVHVALTPLAHPRSGPSILEGGVVASIDADPALRDLRASGFWFAVAGVALVSLGRVVTVVERRDGVAPAETLAAVAGLATVGTVLMPASGFPSLFVPVVVGWRARRLTRGS